MSSSYHPQTDGQTERVNQCLETFLRCFVYACPKKWRSWLAVAEFWYNTSFHSALGRYPFEVLYGRQPRFLGITAPVPESSSLSDWLSERHSMTELVHQHLLRAKSRMKAQFDKGRSERQFTVGDWVYVKLQPYIQSSVAHRSNQKLSFKYIGPYQALSRVGNVAYRVQLPEGSSVHPVIHVSQLNLANGFKGLSSSLLPQEPVEFQIPLKILQSRTISVGGRQVNQVMIQWSGLGVDLATWEDLYALRHRFPYAPAWGQAGFQGGWNVNNKGVPDVLQLPGPSCRTATV